MTSPLRELALLKARAADAERKRREEEEKLKKELARRDKARKAVKSILEPFARATGFELRAVELWTSEKPLRFRHFQVELGDLTFRVVSPDLIELNPGNCQKCNLPVCYPIKFDWSDDDNLTRIGEALLSYEESPICPVCDPRQELLRREWIRKMVCGDEE
jgi:hypothetical protein